MEHPPVRVLNVVGSMNRGGAETWLMHVLRHLDRERFQVDFLVHTTEPGDFDAEIKSLGGRVMPCLSPAKPLEYRRNFRQILHEFGPYQAVHSHVHHFSGYVLWLASQAGVPVRIAHSHLDSHPVDQKASLPRRMYLTFMKTLIARYATLGLTASDEAAPSLFGQNWKNNPHWQRFYCAIDLAPFAPGQKAVTDLRQELGIPPDAFVIGHVGRFFEQKNHAFIPKVAQAVVKQAPHVRFLLVGDGPLRPQIEQQVVSLGLTDYFIFAGVRSDIPYLMREVMDVFFLPSLYEGLPLVTMEAQAAGLPLILSDRISPELNVIPELVAFKSLTQPITAWADALLTYSHQPPPIDREIAFSKVAQSPFNIQRSIKDLEKHYLGN